MTAPITDADLARLEADIRADRPICLASVVIRDTDTITMVAAIIARIRAAEVRAEKAEEERDELRRCYNANVDELLTADEKIGDSYKKGRADERAEVIAEVDRAIRMYGHAGAPDEVRVLTAVRDDIATLTHFTGKGG